jgi:thioredoxin reductase
MDSKKLIILGAGPSALEVAAAHVFQKNPPTSITLIEKGASICSHILSSWPDVKMFSTMEHNVTENGLKLINQQQHKFDLSVAPTGREFVEGYCTKLADALLATGFVDFLTNTTALSVSRTRLGSKSILDPTRKQEMFRVLMVRTEDGEEIENFADIVIDCTGLVYDSALGAGGSLALGERSLDPNLLRRTIATPEDRHAGRDVVVVGSGYSAATTVINLLESPAGPPNAIKWITRRSSLPIYEVLEDDVLPLRKALCERANEIMASNSIVTHIGGDTIKSVHPNKLVLESGKVVDFNEIFVHVGARPDTSLTRELQIHTCYATEGPMKLAASLMGGSGDCMSQASAGVDTLRTTEAGFFIVGSKSYGRKGGYLHKIGGQQAKEIAEAPSS